jgi:hypothetical protein
MQRESYRVYSARSRPSQSARHVAGVKMYYNLPYSYVHMLSMMK